MEKCNVEIRGSYRGDDGCYTTHKCQAIIAEGYGVCEDHLDETARAIRFASRDILAKLEEIRQAMTLKSKSVNPMDHYTDHNGKTWRG